jgi:formamidopyrimidine-DNA glycosylase
MPELPEVETTRRGIEPLVCGHRVTAVVARNPRLRWRVPKHLNATLADARIESVSRRAKYLLLTTAKGTLIIHLGMSGSLRVVRADEPPLKWDHVDVVLDNGQCLRLRDPRRFGAVLWTPDDPAMHKLLKNLGPEPLGEVFSADYLFTITRKRRRNIRDTLLDARLVAGVGNIYANEALFAAGIRPRRPAGRLNRDDCARLVSAIRKILQRAIAAGGTTLRDFQRADGESGYFQFDLKVYGRAGEPCPRCHTAVKLVRLGQRSAFYCPRCQL